MREKRLEAKRYGDILNRYSTLPPSLPPSLPSLPLFSSNKPNRNGEGNFGVQEGKGATLGIGG